MSTSQHKIIILDDNQQRRDALKSMVAEWGYTPFIFEKESRCLDNLKPLDPDLVISGSLSVEKARRFINTLQLTNCGVPVMIISDDKGIMEFIDSNGFGDVCVLNINSDPTEIESAVNRVLQADATENENPVYYPLIIGSNPQIVKIKRVIADIDRISESVLIQGEPGTGKELVARFIHLKSKRRQGPLVKISIPQLQADFFEKQLLILENSQERQKGIFAAAHQGTLLLEEINEMPQEPQATLLKMIDEAGIFKPADDAFDVRFIASMSSGSIFRRFAADWKTFRHWPIFLPTSSVSKRAGAISSSRKKSKACLPAITGRETSRNSKTSSDALLWTGLATAWLINSGCIKNIAPSPILIKTSALWQVWMMSKST
jgi:DNA-binding NtrC family response regulator